MSPNLLRLSTVENEVTTLRPSVWMRLAINAAPDPKETQTASKAPPQCFENINK